MADEKVSIEVLIEASKSAKTLKQLEKSIGNLNDELKTTDKESDAFISLSNAIEEANDSMVDFVVTTENAELTLSQLEQKQEALLEALKGTARGTAEFEELRLALVDVNSEIGNAELGLIGLNREDVAGAVGQLTGAVGTLTSSFVLLGGESGGTIEEIGENIQTAIGITQAFQGAVEGVSAARKLWQNYATAIAKSNVLTKVAAVTQAVLNKVLSLNPVLLIVAGVAALVGGLAFLVTSTNEAKEELDALNATLEDQKASYENLIKTLDELSGVRQKELDDNAKLIQSEIDLIKSKGDLTEADQKRIDELEGSANQIALDKIDEAIATTSGKFGGLGEQAKGTFEAIDAGIRATDYEDGGFDDISEGYTKLLNTNRQLKSSLQSTLNAGFTKDNIDEQIKNIQNLRGQVNSYQSRLRKANSELGGDEKEIFESNISNGQELSSLLDQLIKNGTDYKASLGDKKVETQLQADKKAAQELKDQQDEAKEAEDKAQKARNAYNKRKEQEAKDEEARIKDLQALREEVLQDELATTEAVQLRKLQLEFEANVERAERVVKDEEELADILLRIRENYTSEINKINDQIIEKGKEEVKAEEEKLRAIENLNKQSVDNIAILEKQKELIDADGIKDEIEREKEKYRILDELDKARLDQLKTNLDIQLQNADLTADQRIEIEKQYQLEVAQVEGEGRARRTELELDDITSKDELKKALIQASLDVAQQLADASFELLAQKRQEDLDNQLEVLSEKGKAEDEQLKRQVKLGLKTQRQADREKEKLDKKRAKEEEKIKKEAFEKDKKAKTAQALINGALAILNVFASTPPPASYILAAVQAVATGIQVATIKSQKFAKGGILDGPSHSAGGIKTPFGEMEGGEAVINKTSTKIFRKELSMINEAGGGVKFAQGGVIPTQNQQIESGSGLSDTLGRLNETLNQPLRSYVVENDITSAQNKTEQLERNANV